MTVVNRISKFLCADETTEVLLLADETAEAAGDTNKKGYYYCPDSGRLEGNALDSNKTEAIAVRMEGVAVRWGNVTEKDAAILKAAEKNSNRRFGKKEKGKAKKKHKANKSRFPFYTYHFILQLSMHGNFHNTPCSNDKYLSLPLVPTPQ